MTKIETKESPEMVQAKEKLKGLRTQLADLNEKISSQHEEPSVDESNARKILDGVKAADLGQQSADLRTQKQAMERAIAMQVREIEKLKSKKRIRLLLKKPWADFAIGSKILFDPRKGRPLIANGTGVEIPATNRQDEYLPNEPKKQGNGKIRLKLLKKWGGFGAGSVVDFGESKGRLLITNGTAVEVSKKEKLITLGIGKLGVLANV